MAERPVDNKEPQRLDPASPRRVVSDWEYKTSYVPELGIRIPEVLLSRLGEWAKQDRMPLRVLIVRILEQAVHARGE